MQEKAQIFLKEFQTINLEEMKKQKIIIRVTIRISTGNIYRYALISVGKT